MFSNAFQSGLISIFYSVGSNPLALWDSQVKNGHIRRVIDDEVKSLVLEISGTNVATTYITCPILPRASLGIKLPFFVMVVKNMKKYFTFEIQILDDKDMRRRFRVSNFQSTTKVRPFCTTMPIGLNCGWNQVQFNLADFTKRAYGSTYIETVRVQIHANVRIRRLYFTDNLLSDEDLPNDFKLFGPLKKKESLRRSSGGDKPKVSDEPTEEAQPTEEMPPPPSPVEGGTTAELSDPEKKEGEEHAGEEPFEEGAEMAGGVPHVGGEEEGEEDYAYLMEDYGEEDYIHGFEEGEGEDFTAEGEEGPMPTERDDAEIGEGSVPTEGKTDEQTTEQGTQPSVEPSGTKVPAREPSGEPVRQPSVLPSGEPDGEPAKQPSGAIPEDMPSPVTAEEPEATTTDEPATTEELPSEAEENP